MSENIGHAVSLLQKLLTKLQMEKQTNNALLVKQTLQLLMASIDSSPSPAPRKKM